jgi:aminocarboxymuconate-semialdehyde decarboxylase
MQALQSGRSSVNVTIDSDGNPNLHYPGDYNVAVRGHRDLAYRQEVLDTHGVTRQVVTLTTPGTHVESPATAVKLAALVNDEFKEAMDTRGHHFTALATLPLNDAAASAKEFDRATGQLGMPGAMLFSNINGVALSDARFWPMYERANELGAVLYIHPAHPVNVDMMQEYWLMPLCGFLFDTTLAAAALVFSGVVERFPKIRWALCHLGGTIPYLAERLDRGFHAFKECRAHIDRPPTTYLRTFFYDTVNFDDARRDCQAAGERRAAGRHSLPERGVAAGAGRAKGRGRRANTMRYLIGIACALAATHVASSRAFARAEMTRVTQFENERAVSWKSVIPAHTESTLHRHDRYRTVIAIVGGDLTLVSADGRKTVTRYETGKAYWQTPMPAGEMHKDVNESNKTIELVVVELK